MMLILWQILAVGMVFSILILVHEFGHFWTARRFGVRVEKFSLGFGKVVWSTRRGETEYQVAMIPIGGFVKMAGESVSVGEKSTGAAWEYSSQKPWRRFLIVAAGPSVNYITAFLLFVLVAIAGTPTLTSRVGSVLENFPAAAAGIQTGDRIMAIDGQSVALWDDVLKSLARAKQRPVRIQWQRADQFFDQTIMLADPDPRWKAAGKRVQGVLGIRPSDEWIVVRRNVFQAVTFGLERVWTLTTMTYRGLWQLVTRQVPAGDALTGPIGIFHLTGQTAALGLIYLVQMMAILSAALAIFNFLPIPILDGGHMLFIVLEMLRGRPVSAKIQEFSQSVAFYLLISLMVFVTYHDFVKLGWIGKLKGVVGG